MMETKKISAIIPVYNGAKYIRETIESIEKQTYPVYEIIIVNDGSTDDTLIIIEEYAKEDSRIRIFSQINGKQAKARNIGIKNAMGEYIAFCDADDLWVPEKLEKQMQLFGGNSKIVAVFSGMSFLGSKKGESLPINKNSLKSLLTRNYVPNSSVIISKKIIEKVGYQNESRLFSSVEDYEYWIRIAYYYDFYMTPEPLVRYRVHDTQDSKRSEQSYLKLSNIYKRFLFDIRYYRYWYICFYKFVENLLKFYYMRIWENRKK